MPQPAPVYPSVRVTVTLDADTRFVFGPDTEFGCQPQFRTAGRTPTWTSAEEWSPADVAEARRLAAEFLVTITR